MGSWAYTGLDVVSFLNGVDKLGKSFGKFQTAIYIINSKNIRFLYSIK